MADQLLIVLISLLILGVIFIILLILRVGGKTDSGALAGMKEQNQMLYEQLSGIKKELDVKLSEAHKISHDQFGKTAGMMQNMAAETQRAMNNVHSQSQKIISEVAERLTKLDETNKQVVNFSSQLQNLQDILKNPKQRGVLGEYYLEETLKNVMPPNSYKMQYGFKNGDIVDAVVFVKDKIIPIDSKFSLENYERILNCPQKEEREKLERLFKQDLKTRIDETSKYVRPSEGTMEFAFMFIPSEAIYYDLLVNKVGAVQVNTRDLVEYAFRDKHVIIVSPTSFLAYLQTVLQGLRALQIEESAKMILANVEKLGRHLLSYESFLQKMGNTLGTTVNHYNSAYKEFQKIDKDVARITEGEAKVAAEVLDKPKTE